MRLSLICAVLLSVSPAFADKAKDESGARKMFDDFSAAWAKHDAKTMTTFWTDDASLINPFGRTAKGTAEIEKLFQDEQTGPLKNSTVKFDVTDMIAVSADTMFFDGNVDLT